MKSGFLEGFFARLLKKLVSMGLLPSQFFVLEKGKLQHFPLKALKGYLKNLKNIQCCRSAILEIRNIPDLFRNLLENNYEKERNGLILRNSFA